MINIDSSREILEFAVLMNVCVVLAGATLQEAIVYFSKDIRFAYLALALVFLVFFMFSGLFIKAASLPHWLGHITSISAIRWAMQGGWINLYQNNSNQFPTVGTADTFTIFLTIFGWGGKSKYYCVGMIVIMVVVFRVAALICAGISSTAQKGGRKFRKEENIIRALNLD